MKLSHVCIILNAFIKIRKIPDGKPERKGRFRLSEIIKSWTFTRKRSDPHLDLFAGGSNFSSSFVRPFQDSFDIISVSVIPPHLVLQAQRRPIHYTVGLLVSVRLAPLRGGICISA
ncbi:hypothetical protein AVEN_105271-1 [Araneus ventricosus]|uniref:Uncharacterized protein n=1 Tax=Araneus ventricosus TaxID=182803 RepID=A0A4Y2WGI6_ARAVE|nr:hypothetical protein AVEN_105271-1 [Araneus ventricosus]